MTPIETILYWKHQNISVVPLYYRSKYPHAEALINSGYIKSDGKATWMPLKDQPATDRQIGIWYQYRPFNLALITTDNLVVLDFDDMADYANWLCWQSVYNPSVLDTYCVLTSRGIHLYYWIIEPFEPIKSNGTYEIKSHGKMVTIPPSVHPSGVNYSSPNCPQNIKMVDSIEQLLTFSPVKLTRPVVSTTDPWAIRSTNDNGQYQPVNLLGLFPDARQTDNEGRYWITNCPIHHHKDNFWLDTKFNICGCYKGCGNFLASEIENIIKE